MLAIIFFLTQTKCIKYYLKESQNAMLLPWDMCPPCMLYVFTFTFENDVTDYATLFVRW